MRSVRVHSRLSTFVTRFCIKRLLGTQAAIVAILIWTNIPSLENYFLVGRCLSLLPTLKKVEIIVECYFEAIQIMSHLVFDSLSTGVVFLERIGHYIDWSESPVFRCILKRGVESKRIQLEACPTLWCKRIRKEM